MSSKISDLYFRYLHKKLGASKATPATLTASAGTVRTAVCAALTEADDYWNGSIGIWVTGPNAGLYSSVKDFDAASDTLTFDEDLPNAVANTHQFILLHGGKYASDRRVPGLTAVALANVTGFTIAYVAMMNGEGSGTLKFKFNGGVAQGLRWTPPGGIEGAEVDISGLANGQSATLYSGDATSEGRCKFIIVTRTAAALPGGDVQDAIGLTNPTGSFLPMIIGEESAAGVTFYRPVAIENIGDSSLKNLKAYCTSQAPSAAATTIAAGGAIGTGAATLKGTSFANWLTHGFVINTTKNDARYFYDRSGNSVSVASPGGGIRGFAAVAWDVGDAIELLPWLDIGLDAPGGGSIFEDPASETTAPAGVAFSCPRTQGTALVIGDLAALAVYCVWERYFIPANFRPLEAGLSTLRIYVEAYE